jgi:uncharacterized protein YcfL
MKKLLLLLPLITLLTACQSKRETCAQWASQQLSHEKAASKLGIKLPSKNLLSYSGISNARLGNYCDYYQN